MNGNNIPLLFLDSIIAQIRYTYSFHCYLKTYVWHSECWSCARPWCSSKGGIIRKREGFKSWILLKTSKKLSCVKYTKVIWKWLFPLLQNQFSGSKTWILLILQGNQCHVETLDIMSESYPFFLCYRDFVWLVGLALLMISGSSENHVQKCLLS